jgi:hypothetical protein
VGEEAPVAGELEAAADRAAAVAAAPAVEEAEEEAALRRLSPSPA